MSGSVSNRRGFLCSAAVVGAAGALAPYWFTSANARGNESPSKNDRPRIGAIGIGVRGMNITSAATQWGDVVAICDADKAHAEAAKAALGGKADVCQDYRKLLDRNDIDVIINATPDHWHAAINIAACRSGRDVYAEKPLTLTIDEGKVLCRVVEETGRIVQVGTMHRSMPVCQTAVELVRNGRIGRLQQVWVAVPYCATKGGPFAVQPVPPELDWNLYQGQAPVHDYCPQRTHLNFRWWYEYSGGMVTDWGAHYLDIAHWGMDCDLAGPASVEASGLFPNPDGPACFNTPDRFFSRLSYANGVDVLFFSSLRERMSFGGFGEHQETSPEQVEQIFGKDTSDEIKSYNRVGIMFIGEKGRVFVNGGGVYGKAVEELKENPLPPDAWRAYPSTDHMANFFDCVKTRKQPCTPVQVEHRSATACHLVNISLRLKRKLAWDVETQQIVGDDEANACQKRAQRSPYVIAG
jgi:myo-inositol 2-dehydrogenase / D-chiro-inositol 1-dehydrogenase